MGRAPLVLLLLAVGAVAWLLAGAFVGDDGSEGSDPLANGPADGDLLARAKQADAANQGPTLVLSGRTSTTLAGPPPLTSMAAGHAPGVGPPPATIHFVGRVKDPRGAPASDVEIIAIGAQRTLRFKADTEGRFEQTMPAGRYDLLFRNSESALLRRGFRIDGALDEESEFTLRDTGTIVVTVVRGDDPVPGVTVQAEPEGVFAELLKASATTGADGQARMQSLPPGRYTITGAVPEGPALTHRVRLTAGEEDTVTVRLPDAVHLTGTVRMGKDGPAVADARVTLHVRPRRSAGSLIVAFATHGDGTFDVQAPRGRPVDVAVQADGLAPYPTRRQRKSALRKFAGVRNAKPVHVDLSLDPGAGVAGLVVDPEGNPVPELQLDIRVARSRTALRSTTSDEQGRYAFPHLAPQQYDIGVLTPGVFPSASERLRVSVGREPLEKNIEVLTARRVSGRVVSTTGQGVPAALVWVAGGGLAMRSARNAGRLVEAYTSANGSFLLADLPSDRRLSLRATMGTDQADPVTIDAQDTHPNPVRLVLQSTGEIDGIVVDNVTGKPLHNVYVDVRPDQWDGRTTKGARTNREGRFRVRSVIPGRWKFTPRLRGYLKHAGDFLDVGRSATKARLELDPGHVFTGRTASDDGKPLRGVLITVRQRIDGKLSGNWTARSDRAGRFRVSGVPRGHEMRLVARRHRFVSVVRDRLHEGHADLHLRMSRRR